MKSTFLVLFCLLSSSAFAEGYPGMSGADMQKLQQMQMCMSKIDQGQMQALEQRQKQFDAEMKALCGSGKRDQAQAQAMSYAKEMMNNPTIKTVKKCSELAKGIVPAMPITNYDDSPANEHVCDSY